MQVSMEIDDDDDNDVMEVYIPAEDEDDEEIINNIRLRKCISIIKHKQMVTHVVLPRKLPLKIAQNEYELPLIALMTDALESLETSLDCVTSSCKLFRGIYNTNTSTDAQIIASEINRLKHGDMFGFFVKNQNCGLSVYIPQSGGDESDVRPTSAIVSTFPVLIPNEEIYGIEETVNSDFQMEFPYQSINVDFSTMLNSIEFSQQLSFLNSNEITGKQPDNTPCVSYVTQWLVPMLSKHDNTVLRHTEFPIISKKIRDESIGAKNQVLTLPFRRSTLWTFLKAILQFNLTIELDEITGKILYKLIMMKALTILCSFYNSKMYTTLNVDVVLHTVAKLARRIEKLNNLISLLDQDYVCKFDALPTGFEDVYNATMDESKLVIYKVKEKLDRQIRRLQSNDEENSTLVPLSGLDFVADVKQKLPSLRKYLGTRQVPPELTKKDEQLRAKLFTRHPLTSLEIPDVTLFRKLRDPLEKGIFLSDFENWILYASNDIRPEALRSVSFAYGRLAAKHYKDDPLGFSRMVLTQIKIITLLDNMAINVHKLLKKHRPGIRKEIFDNLLLPQYEDFEIAHDLKTYLAKRSEKATHPSLIEEEKVSSLSFSHLFAKNNDEMQNIIIRIQQSTDETISGIKKEWELRRREVNDLRKRMESVECQYFVNSNGKRQHKDACPKCNLETKILNVRVTTLELPLPLDERERNAIVFELRIPVEIACLRDVLLEMVQLLNEPGKKMRIFERWSNIDAFTKFDQSSSERVFLGTTVKGRVVGRTRTRGVHPDKAFESCILQNSRTCTFYAENEGNISHIPTSIEGQSLIKCASLSVEKGSPYEALQWTFGISHTQNEVIARQFECPQSLTLCEYKNFGSLRADGHYLHLRKLYAMIETESLSFETLSVQALIMQTLWEVGPSNPRALQWNESHQDLTDPKFASAMVDLIDKFIDKQKSNWKHPLKLMMSVLITVRVFEMNSDENVADRIVQLLVKLRDIAFDWIQKVQTAMHETHAGEQSDLEKLRMNLVEIAFAGALTFFVHFRHEHFDKIFIGSIVNSITAVRFWLEFLVTINGNILLSVDKRSVQSSSKLYQGMFQRLIQRIAVQLESKIKNIIVNDPCDLFEFVKSQWSRSHNSNFQLKDNRRFPETVIISVTIENEEYLVQVGILTGEFLVNNLPVSRLPKIITQHSNFRRVFQDFIFEVQEANGRFDTKHKYNNSYYSFHSNDIDVFVTERRENNDEFELIPEKYFVDEIPFLLVESHSHWWCKAKNLIEFRPLSFGDANFSSAPGVSYELDLNNGNLLHKKSKKNLLDVTSNSYRKIAQQLSRLESSKYIHIFMDDPQIANVELVRMNIKFLVDASNQQESYDVISNEFNGMRVGLDQNCGTLYGLRQGLLLESIPNGEMEQKKLIILPHGKVTAHPIRDHVAVEINITSTLRTPTFFVYQMDEMCQQLKVNNRSHSAWFYLAYLHALTSYGLPDKFTEMSGTERSFQILQSAFAWSPAPYDDEAMVTLKLIEKLAPIRRVKNFLQSVRWPEFIESHVAQEGFLFITNKLIADSKRLYELHSKIKETSPQTSPDEENSEVKNSKSNEMELNTSQREYFRNLPYFPNLRLSQTFIKHVNTVSTHYIPNEDGQTLHAIRTISNLYHQQTFLPPKSFTITEYLTKSNQTLKGPRNMEDNVEILDRFLCKLRNKWLSLYNVARSGQFSREKFSLLLGLLARGNTGEGDFNAILLLQTVAENQIIFNGIDPPDVERYNLDDRTFSYGSIESILEQHQIEKEFTGRYNEQREIRYVLSVREYIHRIVRDIRDMWPCDVVHSSIFQHTHPDVNLREAVVEINNKFRNWRNIERLMEFLRNIDRQVRRLNSNVDTIMPWYPETLPFKSMGKFHIDFDAKVKENLLLFEKEVLEAEEILTNPANLGDKDWWYVYKTIASPNDAQHLFDAGMFPRLVLSLVLPKLLSRSHDPKLKAIICAVGVQIVAQQRQRRIAIYSQKPETRAALEQEEKNEPHMNWLPSQYPEWLIFEIEQDLTIRPIQVEVAKRMINPPEIGTKHSVMQLNMGEGKTAVIVPILAAILANGRQVCQVTVLKSLFATNLKELRQCLGGMLNRRLYTFPCRRDMPINKYAKIILDIYVECRSLKGVVLTLPEYRLSFQLKIYEASSKDKEECSEMMLHIHKWLNQNVRNILDESDAILQPKYQLIYTLGEQLSLDGGSQRWTVIQALLKRLPYHLKTLWEQCGDEKIEFDSNYAKTFQALATSSVGFRSDVFTPCRILDNYVYEVLKLKLIDDILQGGIPNISLGVAHSSKQKLRLLLANHDVSLDTYNELLNDLTLSQQTTIHILSGFLRFNVLQLVLGKRWRVNYGVNETGPRKMAIPFKAKDVAADMTEFGHPDVAICLTQMSYYYSGLSEVQLHQVFQTLQSQQNAAEIYEGWINTVPHQLVDNTIQSYTGVNLSDPKQRNEMVFPLFKHNMYVIDYWLSNLVFPREAKTFEHKLMCTAWDLVGDNFVHTVSGFSGTNDTKNILPLPIKQNDLKELEQTNDNVRKVLLRPENSGFYHLPTNVRGLQILIKLSKLKIPVLLDAGACMLELNNEQVATKWLDFVDPKLFDATVYFNSNDVMMTVDRNGIICEFDLSVYRNKLDRCLVYLDDAHTRGTDLKFPMNWKACVTLSGEITRDKTVQACMRMRLLGKGHSIAFMASYEAYVRIREHCKLGNAKPKSEHVIDFISKNSNRFEEENTVHWSAAAYNYTKKLVAHKISEKMEEGAATQLLHTKCKDNEYVTLKDMYGIKETASLTQISKNQFDKLTETCQNEDGIVRMVKKIYDGVAAKIAKQAPSIQRFTQSFDEEQEKELEHELEEQRQIERPPPAKAAVPFFEKLLENLVTYGVTSQSFRKMRMSKSIMTLDESLLDKPMYDAYKYFPSPWSKNLYVTKDFVTVTENQSSEKSEEYLRPVWWIARIIHREDEDIYLMLSSYETNQLLPFFRKSSRSVLMSYRPRLSQFHSNLLHDVPLHVTGLNSNPANVIIELDDEVQIAMYAGSMYFGSKVEQDAYCSFMGLIPKPRTPVLELAFEEGFIAPNSYVSMENRSHSHAIALCVKKCKFSHNPVELAIKIIEAHHGFIRKESHVSCILETGTKKLI